MAVATYYTDAGPKSGPILRRHGYSAIGVLGAPENHTPFGMALGCGWGGVHLWRLILHGVGVPGRWIAVGREFWPAWRGSVDSWRRPSGISPLSHSC